MEFDTDLDMEEGTEQVMETEAIPEFDENNPMDLSDEDLAILDQINQELQYEGSHDVPDFSEPRLPTENTGLFGGERGDSLFTPNSAEALELLEEYEQEGVDYKNGYPDFSPFTLHDTPWGAYPCQVEIGHMTGNRNNPAWEYGRRDSAYDIGSELGNFAQADIALAEQMSRDLGEEITPDMIADYRKDGLTWHEVEDLHTMQLLPRGLHSACPHTGGAGIAKTIMAFGDADISDDQW